MGEDCVSRKRPAFRSRGESGSVVEVMRIGLDDKGEEMAGRKGLLL